MVAALTDGVLCWDVEEEALLLAVTRQLLPSSKPKPSLSGSVARLRHSGKPLLELLVAELTGGLLCCAFEALVTTQERLFSKPKPSPSESLDDELQTGKPDLLPVDWLAELFEVEAEVTRQVWLFSQPKPSPSASNDGEEHTGLWAKAGPDCIEISTALIDTIAVPAN